MSKGFQHIAILGGGLLGGSLALALARSNQARSVRLWARKEVSVEIGRNMGIVGSTCRMEEAVQGADLLVLAVPVGAMSALMQQALAAGLDPGCLVTDVGSVKRAPHLSVGGVLKGLGIDFIGSHPMAGSEQGGLEAAKVDLFEGAACLMTRDQEVSDEKAEALDVFWQQVGCRTSWMSALEHDELVARISHLPHVVAASAAHVCLKYEGQGQFGGGGLRDTTRVAAGNPEMWTEILMENREALLGPLRETVINLQQILDHLEHSNSEATRQWLSSAKHLRDALPMPPPR